MFAVLCVNSARQNDKNLEGTHKFYSCTHLGEVSKGEILKITTHCENILARALLLAHRIIFNFFRFRVGAIVVEAKICTIQKIMITSSHVLETGAMARFIGIPFQHQKVPTQLSATCACGNRYAAYIERE